MRNSYTIALILQTFGKGKTIHTSNVVKSMIQLLSELLGISVLKLGIFALYMIFSRKLEQNKIKNVFAANMFSSYIFFLI